MNRIKVVAFAGTILMGLTQIAPAFAHQHFHGGGYHHGHRDGFEDGCLAGLSAAAASTCFAAAVSRPKMDANQQSIRDQVAQYLASQEESPLLKSAMESFRAELIEKYHDPKASEYNFDQLVTIFLNSEE